MKWMKRGSSTMSLTEEVAVGDGCRPRVLGNESGLVQPDLLHQVPAHRG